MLKLIKCVPCKVIQAKYFSTPAPSLQAVGKLRKPLVEGHYETGQLFLHRQLECRAAVLCAWPVRRFDRDAAGFPESFDRYVKKGEAMPNPLEQLDEPEAPIYTTDIYYQIVLDQRDAPYYQTYHRDSGVTFLGEDRVFYTVPGLDYVSHNDIMPYDTFPPTDKDPIFHSLFNKFLAKVPVEKEDELAAVKYNGTSEWEKWLEDHYDSQQLKDIHIQTTNNVRVTVYSFFLGSKEPILKPTDSFQYSSHVHLPSDAGHMWGTYIMEQEDGEFLTIKIPPFPLNKTSPKKRQMRMNSLCLNNSDFKVQEGMIIDV